MVTWTCWSSRLNLVGPCNLNLIFVALGDLRSSSLVVAQTLLWFLSRWFLLSGLCLVLADLGRDQQANNLGQLVGMRYLMICRMHGNAIWIFCGLLQKIIDAKDIQLDSEKVCRISCFSEGLHPGQRNFEKTRYFKTESLSFGKVIPTEVPFNRPSQFAFATGFWFQSVSHFFLSSVQLVWWLDRLSCFYTLQSLHFTSSIKMSCGFITSIHT